MTEKTIAVFGVLSPRRVINPAILGAQVSGLAAAEPSPGPRHPAAPKPPAPGLARVLDGPDPAATYPLDGPAPRYLGSGDLAHASAVTLDDAVSTLLAARNPAVLTHVMITWAEDHDPASRRFELIRVRAVGPGSQQSLGWAAELERPSKAPRFEIPDGASPANAFCVLFPWLSFCQPH